ncbi:stress response small protein YobI, partial [Escherichia coli]|nr:stress response small protein YobI [Escherichia coli]EJB0961064.1 stress response small protein YobI [Shigella flexneri]MCE4405103.1 stress response small protein YobI [Escherichia coli]HCR5844545.1 stress response small protein YobI [Shigella flexneri]HDW1142752.1 stress response small protein YobI [Escherichia coli]
FFTEYVIFKYLLPI